MAAFGTAQAPPSSLTYATSNSSPSGSSETTSSRSTRTQCSRKHVSKPNQFGLASPSNSYQHNYQWHNNHQQNTSISPLAAGKRYAPCTHVRVRCQHQAAINIQVGFLWHHEIDTGQRKALSHSGVVLFVDRLEFRCSYSSQHVPRQVPASV
jgi:hypothetical protein